MVSAAVADVAVLQQCMAIVRGSLAGSPGSDSMVKPASKAVVADVQHVLGTFQAVHGNLEVRRQRFHAAYAVFALQQIHRGDAGGAGDGVRAVGCRRGQIPACSPARRRPKVS